MFAWGFPACDLAKVVPGTIKVAEIVFRVSLPSLPSNRLDLNAPLLMALRNRTEREELQCVVLSVILQIELRIMLTFTNVDSVTWTRQVSKNVCERPFLTIKLHCLAVKRTIDGHKAVASRSR